MYHGYDHAMVRMKELFTWAYSMPAYERLCDVIAQLIIKAGDMRDEGQGGNHYMTRRVMSTVDKHLGEGWQEYKAKCRAPEHVYMLDFSGYHKVNEDWMDWEYIFFTMPTDEEIADLMLNAQYELPVDRISKATVRYVVAKVETGDCKIVRKIHYVFTDGDTDDIHYVPYKYIGENEFYPEDPFHINELESRNK